MKKFSKMNVINYRDEDNDLVTPAEEDEHSASGSAPKTTSDDDVGEMVEAVIGNEPELGKPFSIAQEVEKDEKAVHDIPPEEADLKGAIKDKDQFSDE